MATLVAFILSNRYLLPAVGCLATAVIIYLKGRNAGLKSAREDDHQIMDRIQAELQKKEAQNQNIENQRDKDAETVRTSTTIPVLISLFDKLFNKKASSSDSDKKAP